MIEGTRLGRRERPYQADMDATEDAALCARAPHLDMVAHFERGSYLDATGTASSSSTGSAPGRTAWISRACRSVVRTMSLARAKLSSSVGTGPTRCPSA